MTRDSSPPEALRFSGSRSVPRCAAKPNSTTSTPSVPACTCSPDGTASGAVSSARAAICETRTLNAASPIARPASSEVTAAARPSAAAVRAAESSSAAAATFAPSSSTRRDRPLSASSDTSSWVNRSRDSAAQRNTPSMSAAYLRVSPRS